MLSSLGRVLRYGLGIIDGIVAETSLPSLPNDHQEIAKDNNCDNTNEQEVFLQKSYYLGFFGFHDSEITQVLRASANLLYDLHPQKLLICKIRNEDSRINNNRCIPSAFN